MSNKKQSSVEWLILEIKKRRYVGEFVPYSLFEQAKAMHQKEITDAYDSVIVDDNGGLLSAKEYYNETFGDGNND
jgi:hypothetical protein